MKSYFCYFIFMTKPAMRKELKLEIFIQFKTLIILEKKSGFKLIYSFNYSLRLNRFSWLSFVGSWCCVHNCINLLNQPKVRFSPTYILRYIMNKDFMQYCWVVESVVTRCIFISSALARIHNSTWWEWNNENDFFSTCYVHTVSANLFSSTSSLLSSSHRCIVSSSMNEWSW